MMVLQLFKQGNHSCAIYSNFQQRVHVLGGAVEPWGAIGQNDLHRSLAEKITFRIAVSHVDVEGGPCPSNVCFVSEGSEIEGDYFDGLFKYIQEMLMEEDDNMEMASSSCMFQDCLALQAAEKSFYDALTQNNNNNDDNPPQSCDDIISYGPSENARKSSSRRSDDQGIKKHGREEGECSKQGRNSKLLASSCYGDDDDGVVEHYNETLLCPGLNPSFYEECSDESAAAENAAWDKQKSCHLKVSKRGRPRGSSKKGGREVVDLTSLLTRCAEAAATFNNKTFVEVLKKIRQHSSPYGDAASRLAYSFANALEARFSGGGDHHLATTTTLSTSDFLKAYQVYIRSCPFKRMSNIFANKSIAKLTSEASKIHIIDFGILYGFQWPCIIHGLSLRPGGPPRLKITGIDFPQPGFRPAERVEETGRHLEDFCKRFNVPFEYRAIAKRWDNINLHDLSIDKDEMVVVNCMYRLKNVPDETDKNPSPRDAVLRLFRDINPCFFVHGIVNAMYNASFFTTRFREALFHFSSQFDIFEATMPPEDRGRVTFEQEIFGRDIMNVIACEGTERVERPESYKQWQVRNQIAGFKQLPLDQQVLREVKAKVKMFYHRDFMVDEHSNWMLQGWKGRIMYALSIWESI